VATSAQRLSAAIWLPLAAWAADYGCQLVGQYRIGRQRLRLARWWQMNDRWLVAYALAAAEIQSKSIKNT
jgi:hypothetical protein